MAFIIIHSGRVGRTQKACKLLNYKPSISLEDGLTELAGWAKTHKWGAVDLFKKALKELEEKDLA
jgi:fatty acid-binding protein DegV